MAVLFREETKAVLEALLFVATEPLSLENLCRIAEVEPADGRELLAELARDYRERHSGLQLTEAADSWQFFTCSEMAPYIERLYRHRVSSGLSRAALETLAIIAYRQPITKAELEIIRGVKVDSPLATLVEKKLVEEKGRRDGPGRPLMYGTGAEFLRHFGIKDIAELPPLENFITPDEEV